MTAGAILTVGHSTRDFRTLARLLEENGVTAVADVRSVPMSRFAPQFNRAVIERSLRDAGIKYVFMGHELGARSEDPGCYVDGRVQYRLLARTPAFVNGIRRLEKGVQVERIAVMCTEGEPLECHRTVLISQVLEEDGLTVEHIGGDGKVETHAAAMERLMERFGLAQDDLFRTFAERLEAALEQQERRIAYVADEEGGASSR